MPRPPKLPKLPKLPTPTAVTPERNLLVKALLTDMQAGFGAAEVTAFDLCDDLGRPRGYIPINNVALCRALQLPGLPMGRLIEVSGWEGSGKSTLLDEAFAAVQRIGGIGVLADTEGEVRDRAYMGRLGVQFDALMKLGVVSVEDFFDKLELFVRVQHGRNAEAWVAALNRRGAKCPACPTYTHVLCDPITGKPVRSYTLAHWGRPQTAALMAWQERAGVPVNGIRDAASRVELRPAVCFLADEVARKEALKAWEANGEGEGVVAADAPVIVGWDSIAATPTEAELAGSSRDDQVAEMAKRMKKNLRRLTQLMADEAVTLIATNQRYHKIELGGPFRGRGGGSETYGGTGVRYHASIRVELKKTGKVKMGDRDVGQVVKAHVEKNKLAAAGHDAEYLLLYGQGTQDEYAIYEDAKARGLIRVSGSWSAFGDPTVTTTSFHGWKGLGDLMRSDPALDATVRAIYLEGNPG